MEKQVSLSSTFHVGQLVRFKHTDKNYRFFKGEYRIIEISPRMGHSDEPDNTLLKIGLRESNKVLDGFFGIDFKNIMN